MKVTGSITVSIEPSNEDGGGAAAVADDCGSILVDVLLKSLVNDAVKKYVTTIGDEDVDEDDEDDDNGDLSSPLPQRRIPANADDSVEEEEEEEEEEASVEDEDEDDDDEAGDLPNVQVDYRYADDNSLSQKMTMMNLRRK